MQYSTEEAADTVLAEHLPGHSLLTYHQMETVHIHMAAGVASV